MFNLENAIHQWRYQLGSATDASEREARLRASLAELQGVGLGEEEAFLVASHRMKGPASKTIEYETQPPPAMMWRASLNWMLFGALTLMVAKAIVWIMESLAALLIVTFGPPMPDPLMASIIVSVVAYGVVVLLLLTCWHYIRRGWSFASVLSLGVMGAVALAGPIIAHLITAEQLRSQPSLDLRAWLTGRAYVTWATSGLSVVIIVAALLSIKRSAGR